MPEVMIITEEDVLRVLAVLRRLPIDELEFYNKIARWFQQQLEAQRTPEAVWRGND